MRSRKKVSTILSFIGRLVLIIVTSIFTLFLSSQILTRPVYALCGNNEIDLRISDQYPQPGETITISFTVESDTAYYIFIDDPDDQQSYLWSQALNNLPEGPFQMTIDLGSISPPLVSGGFPGFGYYVIQINNSTVLECSLIEFIPCLGCTGDRPAEAIPSGNGGDTNGGTPGENPCDPDCETAIGNFSTNPLDFVGKVLSIAVGLAGGIAFILMVIGAIRVLTSAGNPQSVNAGRDMIVAALAGLIFIIFSVLILRFIGVNIFGGGLNPFTT